MPFPARHLSLFRWATLCAVLAAFGAIGWYCFVYEQATDKPPDIGLDTNETPDPRLTFATPFRNVKPDVQYVGDHVCMPCHLEIDKKYHAHPMGQSAELVAKATPIERYDAAAHNPCQVGNYELFVEKTGDKVRHHVRAAHPEARQLPDYVTTVDLAIGSGTRGRSYISFEHGRRGNRPLAGMDRINAGTCRRGSILEMVGDARLSRNACSVMSIG